MTKKKTLKKKYNVRVTLSASFLFEDIEAGSEDEAVEIAEQRASDEYDENGVDYPAFTGEVEV